MVGPFVTWKTHKRVALHFWRWTHPCFFLQKRKKPAGYQTETETEAWSIYFRPSCYMAFTIGAPLYSAVKPMRRCTRGRFTRAMVATFRRRGAWFSRLRTLQLVRKGNKGHTMWETGGSIWYYCDIWLFYIVSPYSMVLFTILQCFDRITGFFLCHQHNGIRGRNALELLLVAPRILRDRRWWRGQPQHQWTNIDMQQ